jgi:pyruvate dehydrogenase E1 component
MSSLDQVRSTAAASDDDAQETQEWLEALEAVLDREGPERAHYLLERLIDLARRSGAHIPFSPNTAYVNTIPPGLEPAHPGNLVLEERIRSYIRWNAMAMVVKANKHNPPDGGDLGGHIASFASLATMIGCGQNHFWHAESEDHGGDLSWTTSVRKWMAKGCRRIRTPSSCPISGNSPPCPWAWGLLWPFIKPVF